MSKYEPLKIFLEKSNQDSIPMSFAQIEDILGFKLPPSSLKHRAWWSNNPSNNVMTEAWVAAGFMTSNVDIAHRKLKFERANDNTAPTEMVATEKPMRAPIFGALKGQMIILPDVDLTEPLWPEPDPNDDYDVFA